MNPIYLDTYFSCPESLTNKPNDFAIITAYATTGETWSDSENKLADAELKTYIDSHFNWVKRIAGYSPITLHSEPGWMVNCSWEQGCEIGMQFKQDAIYFVSGDTLTVSYCDGRRTQVLVGAFLKRVSYAV